METMLKHIEYLLNNAQLAAKTRDLREMISHYTTKRVDPAFPRDLIVGTLRGDTQSRDKFFKKCYKHFGGDHHFTKDIDCDSCLIEIYEHPAIFFPGAQIRTINNSEDGLGYCYFHRCHVASSDHGGQDNLKRATTTRDSREMMSHYTPKSVPNFPWELILDTLQGDVAARRLLFDKCNQHLDSHSSKKDPKKDPKKTAKKDVDCDGCLSGVGEHPSIFFAVEQVRLINKTIAGQGSCYYHLCHIAASDHVAEVDEKVYGDREGAADTGAIVESAPSRQVQMEKSKEETAVLVADWRTFEESLYMAPVEIERLQATRGTSEREKKQKLERERRARPRRHRGRSSGEAE
ncbi:hypothetical protein LTR56_007051 [Elasticomyces elasticus]|nr:hypothetical protein LTR56_007051 [Elasticomyces elasticus]KAK3664079.1 hypothetical protein LTR22_005043 [Elasticomyces elasticus]KAK4927648.1 hypothetical protein LTR49_005517 [Elasticomyces elasticus]KAK5767020.1 hypothetical protein LTS12_002785 [Elasticomyces elasticus]